MTTQELQAETIPVATFKEDEAFEIYDSDEEYRGFADFLDDNLLGDQTEQNLQVKNQVLSSL